MKSMDVLPFVDEQLSYNFNSYLKAGADVQSSWVWRYNLDHSIMPVRYRFSACAENSEERFFAINHKEPGLHFQGKLHLDNDPSLLVPDWKAIEQILQTEHRALTPAPFVRNMLDRPPRHVPHRKKKSRYLNRLWSASRRE